MILKMKNPETGVWENVIALQGDKGATFTPNVSEDGVISWTNDGELDNPESVSIKGKDFEPIYSNILPASGTALTSDTIYATTTITDYAFVHPENGWAHGTFTTGDTATVSFSGKFINSAPSIEANKTYEFDVLNGVWAVMEVVAE